MVVVIVGADCCINIHSILLLSWHDALPLLTPPSHCVKVQKYEQGQIGLQFFDMWC